MQYWNNYTRYDKNISCRLKTFTTTALTQKKEIEEESVIKVDKTPDEAEKEKQESKESNKVISQKVVEEEVTVEVIPQSIHTEGITFALFLHTHTHEIVK
jgi:hypothetical protein